MRILETVTGSIHVKYNHQINLRIENLKTTILRNRIFLFLYFIFIFFVGIYAFKRPLYNWDMLAYIGIVISYDHNDPGFVHDTVYHIAKLQLPPAVYGQLADGGLDFRRKMAENPVEFQGKLSSYAVKPLYSRMVYYLYRAGVPIIPATILPSVISYLLIAVLLVFWLIRWLDFFLALGVSCLVMLSAPMWELLRTSSPDCLSAFLLLCAMFFMIERKSSLLTLLFLLLSIFARLDNIIPAFFLLTLMSFSNHWQPRVSYRKYSWMLLLVIVSYLFISFSARSYGSGVLFYPHFSKELNLSYALHTGLRFRDYFALAFSHIMTGLFFSNLLLFLVLALLVLKGGQVLRFRTLNSDEQLIIVIILIITVRFIFHPVVADRFYIAYYLCILILLIRKLNPSGKINPQIII